MQVTKNCTVCNKEYKVAEAVAHKSRFCSNYCQSISTFKPLNEDERQVILSTVFGRGQIHLRPLVKKNAHIKLYSKHLDYITFQKSFLTNLQTSIIMTECRPTYIKNYPYYVCHAQTHPEITKIYKDTLANNFNKLNDLGITMLFYERGRLKRRRPRYYYLRLKDVDELFYREVVMPFFRNRYGLTPRLKESGQYAKEYYIILEFRGIRQTKIISKILERYPVPCYQYKVLRYDERNVRR